MKKILLAAFLAAAIPASAQVVPFGTLGGGGGGASIGSGTALSGCTSSLVYATAGSLLGCNPATVVNGSVSTAARSILSISDTITGASATSNWYNLTGTFPASLSAATSGVKIDLTGDNDSQAQYGLNVNLAGAGSFSLVSAVRSEVTGTGGGNNGVAEGML